MQDRPHVVLDTNILLLDANNLFIVSNNGENVIVLPEVVLDEMDSKKSLMDELGFQARLTGRLLADTKVIEMYNMRNMTIVRVQLDKTEYVVDILLVSKQEYRARREDSGYNDLKIIEIAEDLSEEVPVLFLSNDTNCRYRALSKGLTVDFVREQEDVKLDTMIELEISDEVFSTLELSDVLTVNPEHKQENYSYHIKSNNGNQALFLVNNGKLESIDETELCKQEINPKNREQKVFSAAILSNQYNIIVSEALAGSGKTLIALSSAMKLVRIKKYSGIIYIRNTVHNLEKQEEVGFLSGNEEKFAPFFEPLYDSLKFIARGHFKNKKMKADELEIAITEKVEELTKSYGIKPTSTLGLRGRTFTDSVIIIDELQNLSPSSAQTVFTRIGENCMVIAIGSSRQIDNNYLNKYTSGLAVLIGALKTTHDEIKIFGIELKKVVRGKITEFAERIFSK